MKQINIFKDKIRDMYIQNDEQIKENQKIFN